MAALIFFILCFSMGWFYTTLTCTRLTKVLWWLVFIALAMSSPFIPVTCGNPCDLGAIADVMPPELLGAETPPTEGVNALQPDQGINPYHAMLSLVAASLGVLILVSFLNFLTTYKDKS